MKKKVLAIGMIFTMIFATSCAKKTYETVDTWPAMEKLQNIQLEDITSIDYTRAIVAGTESGTATDATEIEDIVLRLGNLIIISETDEGVTDNDLAITVKTESGDLSFKFEGDVLVLEDGTRYSIDGMDSLRNYIDGLLAGQPEKDPQQGQTENFDILKDMQIVKDGYAAYIYGNDFLLSMPNTDDWGIEQIAPNAFTVYLKAAKSDGFGGDLVTIIAYNLDDDTYLTLPSFKVAGTGRNTGKRFVAEYPTDVRWNLDDPDQNSRYRELKDYLWKIGEGAANSPFQTADSD